MDKLKKMSLKQLKLYLASGIKGDEYKEAMKEYLRRTHE
jgi:hypothetical protein